MLLEDNSEESKVLQKQADELLNCKPFNIVNNIIAQTDKAFDTIHNIASKDSSFMDFDDYITAVKKHNIEVDKEKIKNIESMEDKEKQSYAHISLISRTLQKPIEIFVNNQLMLTIGSELESISGAIQLQKSINNGKTYWNLITSKIFS